MLLCEVDYFATYTVCFRVGLFGIVSCALLIDGFSVALDFLSFVASRSARNGALMPGIVGRELDCYTHSRFAKKKKKAWLYDGMLLNMKLLHVHSLTTSLDAEHCMGPKLV